MLNWLVRLLMICAAGIAGWFVARDAPNFSLVQLSVLLVLMAIVIAAATSLALLDRGRAKDDPARHRSGER